MVDRSCGNRKPFRMTYFSGMRLSLLHLVLCLSGFYLPTFAQTSEYFLNPSFEDIPRQNHQPQGWLDCSFQDESPVDVHGSDTEFFGVKEFAAEGETFLGMVTRDNGTYEGVSAKLKQPLQADSLYKLTIWVNQAETYQSISRTSDQIVNYNSPVRLEIWAGPDYCEMTTLFEEYEVHDIGIWTEVTFYFTPDKSYKFLGFYARHIDEYADTNGNLLLDAIRLEMLGLDDDEN